MPAEEGVAFAMYLLAEMLAGELDTSRGPHPPKRERRPFRQTQTGAVLRAVS